MSGDLRGAAAIVGIGLTEFGELPGRSQMEIMAEAVDHALADAGIGKERIDGVFGADFTDSLIGLSMAEYLGLNPTVIDGTNIGGSSYVNFLQSAALALHAGLCEVALIAYGSNARSAGPRGEGGRVRCPTRPSTGRASRSTPTRSRPRGTCTNTARPGNSSRRSRWRRGAGRR